jgi:AcrR family transcriptional regulator
VGRALSRKESKELTRKRLIEGAIAILRTDGLAGVTTGRVADAAGIAQSSFYGHFADRDACLEAVADKIGTSVLRRVREQRMSIDPGDPQGSVRRSMARVVEVFLIEPELTRLFLRHRGDDETALGRAFGRLRAQAQQSLQRDVLFLGVAGSPAEAEVYAELLIAGTLGVIEGILAGRISDREVAVDGIARLTSAALSGALGRKD